jgi:hypothetical protein
MLVRGGCDARAALGAQECSAGDAIGPPAVNRNNHGWKSARAQTRLGPDHAVCTDPAMSATIRVALADLPGASRAALAQLLDETPGLEVVVLEPTDRRLLDALPDVLILDDRLVAGCGRLDAWEGAAVIVVGVDDNPGYAARALRRGASAWIPKERAELLVRAVLGEPVSLRLKASGQRSSDEAKSPNP